MGSKSPNGFRICPQLSAELLSIAISKSPKRRLPTCMFCAFLCALRKIGIKSPDGSKSHSAAHNVFSALLGLEYFILLFLPDQKSRLELVMAVPLAFFWMAYLYLKIWNHFCDRVL
jgi:hypothetical protein